MERKVSFENRARRASAVAPWLYLLLVAAMADYFYLAFQATGGQFTILTVIYALSATLLTILTVGAWIGFLPCLANERSETRPESRISV